MSSGRSTVQLYRNILKHAKRFPSKKRDGIVHEIKSTFHENKCEADPAKIDQQLSIAIKGLEQLKMYTTLPKQSSSWTVNLEQNPMPKGVKPAS